jgi:cyclophilin family peptidyl-prolyl cis-trans isomerase
MKLSHLLIAGVMSIAAFGASVAQAADDYLTIQLKDGPVVIQLMPEVAPNHVKRLEELARKGEYDNVAFHRVIDGFMAQTGDVKYGNMEKNYQPQMAGMGGSDLPNLKAEFSDVPFDRGVVGMARSQNPNSANSQFFIMFAPGHFLDGKYTVVGKVISGMKYVDNIKHGDQARNGMVTDPDRMIKVTVGKPN